MAADDRGQQPVLRPAGAQLPRGALQHVRVHAGPAALVPRDAVRALHGDAHPAALPGVDVRVLRARDRDGRGRAAAGARRREDDHAEGAPLKSLTLCMSCKISLVH